MVSIQSDAAASLLEQLKTDTSKIGTLAALQATMYGMRMNLATVLAERQTQPTLFQTQGWWRKAFVTSRRNKQQLRMSIAAITHAITEHSGLMKKVKRLARPAVTERRIMAKEEAREAVKARALFEARLKALQ